MRLVSLAVPLAEVARSVLEFAHLLSELCTVVKSDLELERSEILCPFDYTIPRVFEQQLLVLLKRQGNNVSLVGAWSPAVRLASFRSIDILGRHFLDDGLLENTALRGCTLTSAIIFGMEDNEVACLFLLAVAAVTHSISHFSVSLIHRPLAIVN